MKDQKSPLWWILTLFGIATIVALVGSGQRYFIISAWNEAYDFMPLLQEFSNWYLWTAFAFLIYRIALRYPIGRKVWVVSALIHTVAGTLLVLLHITLQASLVWIVNSHGSSLRSFIDNMFLYKFFNRLFFYLMIAVACYAYIFYTRFKRERLVLYGLESQLALTQLQTLRMQLNPEFVFATLHSISGMLEEDAENADRLTIRLGDFLRKSLEYPDSHTVPLQAEIDFLKCYLEIQQIRGGGLPHFQIQAGSGLMDWEVPNLILHQLVDRIFHRSAEVQSLSVRGIQEKDLLRIVIDARTSDSSPGFEDIELELQRNFGENVRLSYFLQEQGVLLNLVIASGLISRAGVEMVLESSPEVPELPAVRQNWLRRGAWIFGCWTLIALFFYTREILSLAFQGEPLNWIKNAKDFAAWYWWAVFTPIVFYLSNRFPLGSIARRRNLIIHIASAGVMAFGMVFLYMFQRSILGIAETPFSEELKMLYQYPYVLDVITYFAILGVGEAVQYHRRYMQDELRSARLRGILTQAQVHVLKMQLQPHFLFNTLNSVAELMHEDVRAARAMIGRLEEFLRITVENERMQEVTLGQELEFLQNYLSIQKIRFQSRLNIHMQIDPEAISAAVPNLILQPIVENAIRHAIAPRMEPGRIEIEAIRHNGVLRLQVRDDGPGLTTGVARKRFREGLGIANTRARLEQLYGEGDHFRMSNVPGGGLLVTLDIPLREVA